MNDQDGRIEKQLERLEEAVQSQAAQYDKAILTVSSSLFALSVAFLKDVAGSNPVWAGLLILSWICLAISVCCTLTSFLTSQSALRHNQDQIAKVAKGEIPDKDTPKSTENLNWASLKTFVIGLLLFCIFAFLNLGTDKMDENENENTEYNRLKSSVDEKGYQPRNVALPSSQPIKEGASEPADAQSSDPAKAPSNKPAKGQSDE